MADFDKYFILPSFSGDQEKDVELLFEVNGEAGCFSHSVRVMSRVKPIAAAGGLDRDISIAAALLHDIGNIVAPSDMIRMAKQLNWRLDPAESRYPLLLHQRISAFLAGELFHVSDDIILNAISCHTTLRSNFNEYDMALFIADKLSWDDAPFRAAVSGALGHSLPLACLAYMEYMEQHGRILAPHSQWTAARVLLNEMTGVVRK